MGQGELVAFTKAYDRDMRFITPQSYEFAAGKLDEIGRLLGGWMKQQGRVS